MTGEAVGTGLVRVVVVDAGLDGRRPCHGDGLSEVHIGCHSSTRSIYSSLGFIAEFTHQHTDLGSSCERVHL